MAGKGLTWSEAAGAFDRLEADGVRADRLGDVQANEGDHNKRHNAVLWAVRNALAAVAIGSIVLGDKEDPSKTAELNSTHIVDLAELGGCEETGADVLYEIKVLSPVRAKRSAGRGTRLHGGCWASVGHLYGFGNTEEEYREIILGRSARGRSCDGPLVHSTGKGWIQAKDGDYVDGLAKRRMVVPMIVEATGAVAPRSLPCLRRLSRRAKGKNAVDRTKYGSLRISARSHFTHHLQRISLAAVLNDARAIGKQITVLKVKTLVPANAVAAARSA